MENKRGWIKIVEAFLSIMLIAGVLIIVITKGYVGQGEISSRVYDAEVAVLREIELDEGLRTDILSAKSDYVEFEPVKWDEFEIYGLTSVKSRIESRIPNYLNCEAKVCKLEEVCSLERYVDTNVYSQSVAITATLEVYAPRQLKLFCWVG